MTTTTNRGRIATALLYALVGVVLVAAAIVLLRPAKPRPLTTAAAPPVAPMERGGAWYWIERRDRQPARIVRAAPGSVRTVAAAEEIVGFDTDGAHTIWAQRTGKQWQVLLEGSGGAPRVVWSGAQSAGRPCIVGDTVLWTTEKPGLLPGDAPLPALAGETDVMAASATAPDQPRVVGSLLETHAHLVGAHGSDLFLVADRQSSTALYRMPLAGGAIAEARRIAGEAGVGCSAAVGASGALWWTAPSRDSSDATARCVRRASGDGPPTTMADWLPAGGDLFTSGTRAFYADANTNIQSFAVEGNDRLPSPLKLPDGFAAVAIGPHTILLRNTTGGPERLFTVPSE